MITRLAFAILGVWCFVMQPTPAQAETLNLDAVQLTNTLYFPRADGSDHAIPGAVYHVVVSSDQTLRLISEDGASTYEITAVSSHHEEELEDPLAVLVADEDDIVHVLLLLPHGSALVASGSSSAIRSRGRILSSLSAPSVSAISKVAAPSVGGISKMTLSPAAPQIRPESAPIAPETTPTPQGTLSPHDFRVRPEISPIPLPEPKKGLSPYGLRIRPEQPRIECPKNGPFTNPYIALRGTGTLDNKMISNIMHFGGARIQKAITEDHQARINVYSCEQAKLNVHLDSLIGLDSMTAATTLRRQDSNLERVFADCATYRDITHLRVPNAFQRISYKWPTSGFFGVGFILNGVNGVFNDIQDLLETIRLKLDVVHCENLRIAAKVDYYGHLSNKTPIQYLAQGSCPALPNPFVSVSGVYPFGELDRTYGSWDQTLIEYMKTVTRAVRSLFPSIVTRINVLYGNLDVQTCRQQKIIEALDLLVDRKASAEKAGQILRNRPTLPTIPHIADENVVMVPNSNDSSFPAPPQKQSCSGILPNPSYIQQYKDWSAPGFVDALQREDVVKVWNQMMSAIDSALNNWQVQLEGLQCGQQNIRAMVVYLFPAQ